MEDGFDIVAVRVQDERGVVAGVVGLLARRPVVAPAMRQRRTVKRVDRRAVLGLEGKVMPAGQLPQRRRAAGRGHHQFIGPEEVVLGIDDGNVEDAEGGGIEVAAGFEGAHHELDVVDEPAAMQLLGFHGQSPCPNCA